MRKRKASYAKKKWNTYQERSRALRDAAGVNGFAALYRVLGLNERKLAGIKEIKKAYRRMVCPRFAGPLLLLCALV